MKTDDYYEQLGNVFEMDSGLVSIIDHIIKENEQFMNTTNGVNYIVGKVMSIIRGKVDPRIVMGYVSTEYNRRKYEKITKHSEEGFKTHTKDQEIEI